MPDFARDFTELCCRIADTERRIRSQRARIARRPPGSDDVLYSTVLVGVLERSLRLMYRRRDRIERELVAHLSAAKAAAEVPAPPKVRLREPRPTEVGAGMEARSDAVS